VTDPVRSAAPVPADADAGPDDGADWTSAEAEAFWTPERMAEAVPDGDKAAPASPSPAVRPEARGAQAAAPKVDHHFAGVASVGVLFSQDKNLTTHYCTASVVKSPGRNLILTAGHCGPGSHAAFVPKYYKGADPHLGIWAVTHAYIEPGRQDTGPNSNLDFQFDTVADRGGLKLEDQTGGNTLTRTPGYVNQATVIGYPALANKNKPGDHTDEPIKCPVSTSRLAGAGLTQMTMTCDGFYGGTSGSPWLINFNGATGDVIGDLGGQNTGGLDPNVSYAPVFGDQVFSLYQQATTGAVPPPAAYSMGDRTVWTNARHVVAGNFTGKARAEDMITVWVDGEVTLYHGDGNTHFTGETQLVPPKSIWKDAVSITAGTFTPESNQSGLVVRWIDGELDLYPNVSAAGIGNEVRLENSNSTWTKATAVAGQFGGNGKVPTALVVAWSDGHVSEFPNITSHSMAGEVQMIAANKTWTWMRGITAGDLAGNNGSDLVVRWLDGTLTLYPDVDNSGTHQEITLLPPNTAWTNVTDMTVGNFSANGWPDDLVALFPDGQLTMYPDSGSKGLGAPVTLVA